LEKRDVHWDQSSTSSLACRIFPKKDVKIEDRKFRNVNENSKESKNSRNQKSIKVDEHVKVQNSRNQKFEKSMKI